MSIRAALEPYRHRSELALVNRIQRKLGLRSNLPWHKWRIFHGHASAMEAKENLPPDIFDRFFKFAFVRNPWDWQVSLYYYALKDPGHQDHERLKKMKGFEEYLEWRIQEDFHLQQELICGPDGRPMLDFVGRFEQLQDDFTYACSRIGIQSSLHHANRTAHPEYRTLYTTKTRQLVAEAFRKDIELFGYDFEGPNGRGIAGRRPQS
jgi:Sulfotransferase family